ncbi:MAG: CotH kinase family protein [Verrucomicrobia bacterium]|nr:CotH kinase family protein [Verrucomicrobiota bacterium]
MKKCLRTSLALAALWFIPQTPAGAADIVVSHEGSNAVVRIEGDPDNDWFVQTSTNLTDWTSVTGLTPVIAGRTNSPTRTVPHAASTPQFYRALKTGGLYDPSIFRTVSLTFTQLNWSTLLTSGRATGSNVYCSLLTLDNGATNIAVGARYKGNTSFNIGGSKKSINLELDWVNPSADLMTYSTINLNNAAGDETIQRECLYFTVMSRYTPCPKASMSRVNINGSLWGVYTLVQQENGQLISEWFPSNNGDRWRTPNAAGGGGGGGGFSGSNSALAYLSTTNIATYRNYYDLRTTNSATNVAWSRLINAIQVLNTTPTNQLRDKVEDVLGVDSWLWFLGIEIIFADDDSYWNKGADYSFYFEPESGRIHPVEHDGNEAFVLGDVSLSPLVGYSATGGSANLGNRPLLHRLLRIDELRQRYLAHMRTVLEESYHPAALTPLINQLHALSANTISADPNKNFTMAAYTNDLHSLRMFVTNRYNFLTNHADLRPRQPIIASVSDPAVAPTATEIPFVTTQVLADGTNGIDSVWLYHRGKSYGRFAVSQMFDDGAHGDGAAGDGIFGGATTNYPAGTKVRYYVEARSANAAKAARFSPARAEQDTYSYRVAVTTASNSPVIINEILASNTSTLADPQGEFDDWIELRNVTDQEVDLTGRYLSDEPNNPRKWAFPAGTKIPADDYLLIWCDEDGLATPGLHASFKLSASGESIFLTDTDANQNAILDSITFGALEEDQSYGRAGGNADLWSIQTPTPEAENPPSGT